MTQEIICHICRKKIPNKSVESWIARIAKKAEERTADGAESELALLTIGKTYCSGHPSFCQTFGTSSVSVCSSSPQPPDLQWYDKFSK